MAEVITVIFLKGITNRLQKKESFYLFYNAKVKKQTIAYVANPFVIIL